MWFGTHPRINRSSQLPLLLEESQRVNHTSHCKLADQLHLPTRYTLSFSEQEYSTFLDLDPVFIDGSSSESEEGSTVDGERFEGRGSFGEEEVVGEDGCEIDEELCEWENRCV